VIQITMGDWLPADCYEQIGAVIDAAARDGDEAAVVLTGPSRGDQAEVLALADVLVEMLSLRHRHAGGDGSVSLWIIERPVAAGVEGGAGSVAWAAEGGAPVLSRGLLRAAAVDDVAGPPARAGRWRWFVRLAWAAAWGYLAWVVLTMLGGL
jgi:hypothetical protein